MRKEEIKYRMIISTNTFAANFDKEFCAFATGQIGQCNVGIDRRYRAPSEVREMFEKAMERRMCVDDYWRPVGPNVDDANAFELFFKEKPTEEMIKSLQESFEDFADEKKEKNPLTTRIAIERIRIIKERSLYEETDEAVIEMPVTN